MQSGITVSKELQDAFNELVSSPAQRGLLATIQSETLIPSATLPSTSTDFHLDISSLQSQLKKDAASYIILRRYQNAPDGYVAITYIPDTAPVRQKMLFASTRLTLVRELGTERFRESIFVTDVKELEPEGWKKHDASGASEAPLTEEEESLKGIKEAEAEARGGTQGRRLETGGHFSIAMNDEAKNALERFKQGGDNLVQLVCSLITSMKEVMLIRDRKSMWLLKRLNLQKPRPQMQEDCRQRSRRQSLAIPSSGMSMLWREGKNHPLFSFTLVRLVQR